MAASLTDVDTDRNQYSKFLIYMSKGGVKQAHDCLPSLSTSKAYALLLNVLAYTTHHSSLFVLRQGLSMLPRLA